ncbi:unnamed protein product [Eruca vesicaria subsp. sativa]|uniref:NYN domain-containing protein n=1 Tax=Eruca vesicaria subsp. sativa TaxID=29727 RepID=A0ABC8J925_ERUVS|nr:unnamed protein product [Eruca vesicaria subsp. sativa]
MSIRRTSRQDGRFITAETIAFWDINACPMPDGLDARDLSESVHHTLLNMDYYSKVCLRLYGDIDMDKIGYTDNTLRFCGMPRTTILEQILVDLYGGSVSNRGTPLNMVLIVGDISKDIRAVINAFSLLPKRGWVNILVCQSSAVEAAVFSSEVQLPPWEKIVETAFAIREKKKKEREDSRKRAEENRASYLNGTAKVSRIFGEF